MLDPVTNEIIYSSNGCDEMHESEDTGNEELNDDNNLKSNIRRRKGKIISCAKETIEQGKIFAAFKSEARSHKLWVTQIDLDPQQ